MKSRYIKPELYYLMVNGQKAIMGYEMGNGSEFAEDPDTKRRFDDFDENAINGQDNDGKMSLW
ncbi:MAG: hypothetical protein ACI3YI_03390 [Bacteroidaceae bacterium]